VAKKAPPEATEPKYAINLDWYEQNHHSFAQAVRTSLCDKCKHKIEGKGIPPHKIIALVKGCCSNETGFINDRQPILESVFRVFLSNGNKPIELEELSKLLAEQRSGDKSRSAPEVLSRLLKKEDYYGIRAV